MPDFKEEDWALPTLLSKDGEPSFHMECHTLQDAFVRVEKWPLLIRKERVSGSHFPGVPHQKRN